jgi:rare lipoprotein A
MRKLVLGLAVAGLTALSAPSVARQPASLQGLRVEAPELKKAEVGLASWYGAECHGNLTASGEIYDMNGFTAAHRTIPLGSLVKVTNLRNHRSVIVRVNDRGPGIEDRVIDLSLSAARQLGYVHAGLTPVEVEVVQMTSEFRYRQPRVQAKVVPPEME